MNLQSSFEDFFYQKKQEIYQIRENLKKEDRIKKTEIQQEYEELLQREKLRIERVERIRFENELREKIKQFRLKLEKECMDLLSLDYTFDHDPIKLRKVRREIVFYIENLVNFSNALK